MSVISNSDLYTSDYFLQGDVCRLCWSRDSNHQEISPKLSEINSEFKHDLIDKIRDCLDIILIPEFFVNKICLNCHELIDKFHLFKVSCKEKDRKLHELFNKAIIKVEKLEDISKTDIIKYDCTDNLFENLSHCDSDSDHKSLKQYARHKKTVKIKTRYKCKRSPTYCNICRLDFENKDRFSVHNAQFHGIEEDGGLYKCFGCEKRFKSRKTRLGHEINFCKGLKDGYKCSVCDRYLPKRRTYEAHMRDHRDKVSVDLPDDIFECVKCYKMFKTKQNLKNHMDVHENGKKNFVCESCGRVFTRQDYLHKHKLTHSGVKRHVCPHCGFRATQRSSLTVHIRKHTGERPYSCDVCPQRCISSSNLRAHRRRHLGLKKYECTICNKKFGYKISLEEHVASTHERSQSHPCQHCGATYTRVRGLRRHLSAKHGKQNEKNDAKSESSKNDFMKNSDLYMKIVTENDSNTDRNKVDNILKGVVCELKDAQQEFVMKDQNGVFVV